MPVLDRVEITTDELVEQFGDYYINEGQNMDNLHMLPFEAFGTAEAGTVTPTDQTVLREANVRVDEVLQSYQHPFTNKGGMSVLPVSIFLHHVKIDVKILPNELKAKWIQFLTTDGLDPLEYPLVRFIIENYLINQANEDLELKGIYKGVRAEAPEGESNSATEIMDGIEFHLNKLETDGKLDWINTGSIASAAKDFVTQIEDFVKAMPEKYRYNTSMQLNMNRTLRDKYKQGMRDKYNVNYQQTNTLLQVMDFENVSIVGRASMAGKNKIWTTPKDNLIIPVKGFSNKSAFDVQKVDREVKFLSDWWIGAGFIQPEIIFANELT
jgi:hypothetical protein